MIVASLEQRVPGEFKFTESRSKLTKKLANVAKMLAKILGTSLYSIRVYTQSHGWKRLKQYNTRSQNKQTQTKTKEEE